MEKRLLLAVILTLLVLYAFNYNSLTQPPKPQTPAPQPATTSVPNQTSPSPALEKSATPDTSAAPAPAAAAPLVADSAARDVVVENEDVRAVFSTRGAVLTSWRLKKYAAANGEPLDLVPDKAPAGSMKPFTLTTDDAAVSEVLTKALYKPSADSVNSGAGPASLVFEYRDASGLSARKEFAFTPDQPYLILFSGLVSGSDGPRGFTINWGPALATGTVSSGLTYSPSPQPIFHKDGKAHRIGFADVPKYTAVDGSVLFGGVDDHYFLSAALPAGQPVHLAYEPVAVPVPGSEQGLHFVSWSARFTNPTGVRFFAGPKDFDVLEGIDPQLTYAIDFGMFRPLVVPLLRALKWVNGYVGNYGWAIIALTIIINLAMFPLRHKSVVSMRKMQDMQPEVKAIQDRYAKLKMSDPARQKMNVELMNLYRERGVNPASGCVPMLLTMPVLFAFYAMLSVAIELRGAPFVGWIRDLSVYDPWFVTPVLMGATQFVQTKMTPATGDPQQQRIMLFMPLIFMTMFIWAPSGLVLYWTVSNMWAIGQQILTNKLIGPAPQRSVRPAAERQLKSAGGGKSDAAKERK